MIEQSDVELDVFERARESQREDDAFPDEDRMLSNQVATDGDVMVEGGGGDGFDLHQVEVRSCGSGGDDGQFPADQLDVFEPGEADDGVARRVRFV